MTTPYEKGRALEYRVRQLLREKGYSVWRSRGSKTKVDLIAKRPRSVEPHIYIQVDGSERGKPKRELEELREFAQDHDALAAVFRKGRGFSLLGEHSEYPAFLDEAA